MVSSRFRRQVKYWSVKKCWNWLTCLCRMGVCRKDTVQVTPVVDDVHISSLESA